MRLAAIVTMDAVLACGAPVNAQAQNRCEALKLLTAADIGQKIAKTTAPQALIVQLVATNATGGRVYVKSAQWGEGIKPSSGSRVEWFTPVPHGIETTQGFPGTTCLSHRDLHFKVDKPISAYIEEANWLGRIVAQCRSRRELRLATVPPKRDRIISKCDQGKGGGSSA